MHTKDRSEARELAAEGGEIFRQLTVAELDEVTGGSLGSAINNVMKTFGNALNTAARGG